MWKGRGCNSTQTLMFDRKLHNLKCALKLFIALTRNEVFIHPTFWKFHQQTSGFTVCRLQNLSILAYKMPKSVYKAASKIVIFFPFNDPVFESLILVEL